MVIRIIYILFCFSILIFSEGAFAWKMEANKITVHNTSGNLITHINFRQTYSAAPLVFTLATSAGSDPSTLRVINITTTGFDIYSVEPDGLDGVHAQMSSVAYIAIDEGSHELPDGNKIVAGSIFTQKFQSRLLGGSSWQAVALTGFSSIPTVLGQIQSRSNERTDLSVPSAVSQPWITTAINNVTSTGFNIAMERSEITTGTLASNEKIAYLAIDSGLSLGNHYFGSNSGNKVEYETIRTGPVITGWDNSVTGNTVNFAKTYTKPIVVSTKNTRNGVDGGWFRRRNVSTSSIALTIDEDTATDTERGHITEIAGIVLFSRPFDVEFTYTGQASLIINEALYKEGTAGINNDEFIELYVTAGGNLKGTIISDQDTHFYVFPSFNVSTGDYVIYHTGVDPGGIPVVAGVYHFYQGTSTIWNNANDDILLIRPAKDVTTTTHASASRKTFNGYPVDYIAYGRNSVGGGVDAVPTSINSVTVLWDYSFGSELGGAVANESISLTPNATDTNKAACWEKTTSGNAIDNGCAGYIITRTTTAPNKNSAGDDNTASPKISLAKTSLTIFDPYNGASNPKAIPGAIIGYIITAKNEGNSTADNNSIVISDDIPSNTKICVITIIGKCEAPNFVSGTSGLSLASIIYLDAGGVIISPSADADGTDPAVAKIRITTTGSFLHGDPTPSFQLNFKVMVK